MAVPIASDVSDTLTGWSKLLHYAVFLVILTVMMTVTGVGSVIGYLWGDKGE